MLHALLFGTALFAAAPLDASHAALVEAMSRNDDGAGCSPTELRKAVAEATIRTLGRAAGRDVVLAEVYAPCICGAQNCPYYAIRLDPGRPKVLVATFGTSLTTKADTPLPRIIVRSHDSAAVSVESTYAYRGGTYAMIDSARVRGDSGARKPDGVVVRFAPGASSAPLRGTAAIGWYDDYVFDAQKGQRVLVSDVHASDRLSATLFGASGAVIQLTPGKPATLPKSETYHLHVELASENAQPYSLTFAIR